MPFVFDKLFLAVFHLDLGVNRAARDSIHREGRQSAAARAGEVQLDRGSATWSCSGTRGGGHHGRRADI